LIIPVLPGKHAGSVLQPVACTLLPVAMCDVKGLFSFSGPGPVGPAAIVAVRQCNKGE
jgi:hypothetical protein